MNERPSNKPTDTGFGSAAARAEHEKDLHNKKLKVIESTMMNL